MRIGVFGGSFDQPSANALRAVLTCALQGGDVPVAAGAEA